MPAKKKTWIFHPVLPLANCVALKDIKYLLFKILLTFQLSGPSLLACLNNGEQKSRVPLSGIKEIKGIETFKKKKKVTQRSHVPIIQ